MNFKHVDMEPGDSISVTCNPNAHADIHLDPNSIQMDARVLRCGHESPFGVPDVKFTGNIAIFAVTCCEAPAHLACWTP
jgi:hypothetical protein